MACFGARRLGRGPAPRPTAHAALRRRRSQTPRRGSGESFRACARNGCRHSADRNRSLLGGFPRGRSFRDRRRSRRHGCVGCHGFQGHDPLGEDGPDLTHAGRRLRHDWFYRWMRDPARILSGTSMPNYFTSTARAETERTIGALWAAFSHGEKMPLPQGLAGVPPEPDRESLLVPEDEPIVVRWYMPEATPPAIAVGLPGGVSYCFDAGESRLRYAWVGGFLNTTGTLTEKRDPATQRTRTPDLIGDIFYRTVESPLRVGSPESLPATRFRGYRLVDGHPNFTMKSAASTSTNESPPTLQETASGASSAFRRLISRPGCCWKKTQP